MIVVGSFPTIDYEGVKIDRENFKEFGDKTPDEIKDFLSKYKSKFKNLFRLIDLAINYKTQARYNVAGWTYPSKTKSIESKLE